MDSARPLKGEPPFSRFLHMHIEKRHPGCAQFFRFVIAAKRTTVS